MEALVRITLDFKLAAWQGPDLGGVGYGIDYPIFWIDVFHLHGAKQHTAFRAKSRQQVDEFHAAAIWEGGADNGAPGLRTGGYPERYYAAFVLDPDGNNSKLSAAIAGPGVRVTDPLPKRSFSSPNSRERNS